MGLWNAGAGRCYETMVDYLSEVDHAAERIKRLEQAIDDAVRSASPTVRAVIDGLRALRGVAKLTATTLAVEVRYFSRFTSQNNGWSSAAACPANTQQVTAVARVRSRRPATLTYVVCCSRPRGGVEVRGSSRRIMTMCASPARSTNTSLINRRRTVSMASLSPREP